MKKITLRKSEGGNQSSKEVLKLVAEVSPQKSINVDEMRKRVRIMDLIDAAEDDGELLLEDEHHKLLAESIQSFPWQRANAALLTILDDVLKAEDVKPTVVKEKKNA